MQVQKVNIRNRILKVSESLFLEKGYKDTSMRDIAGKAGVSLCNIYNYFENKDKIYEEVLSPLLRKMDGIIEEHRNMKITEYIDRKMLMENRQSRSSVIAYLMEQSEHFSIKRNMQLITNLVDNNKDYLHLLLFYSQGSKFERYKEDFTDRMAEAMHEVIERVKSGLPEIDGILKFNMSPYFIHVNSLCFFSVLEELVLHEFTDAEREDFIEEYVVYGTGGFEAILRR